MSENAQIWLKILAEADCGAYDFGQIDDSLLDSLKPTESLELTKQDKQWLKELRIAP